MLTIKQMQRNLNYLCYGNLAVDGKIGFFTKKAIKLFQKSNELTVDGIWRTS